LPRTSALHPGNGITYLDDSGTAQRRSYPELLEQAARALAGLRTMDLRPGSPVIFQLPGLEDFITAFWACMLGGYVPVPVSISPTYETAHATLSKLRNAWQALGQPVVLSGSTLTDRLAAFADREGLTGFQVADMDDLRAHAPATDWHDSDPDDVALLLLTSGSTGLPKAVRQTHHNLVRWTVSVAEACEFTPDDTSLNWMPLDHVGGLVMFHLRDLSVGCNQVHAPTETVLRSPLIWLDWIQRHRATITWAPNFAFGLVNQHADDIAAGHWDLSSMRFILNGGEAIVARTARRFMELLIPHGLPPTAMRPAWGMSETCSGVTYSRSFRLDTTSDDDAFVSVGEPIPGDTVRIVDADHNPVAAGRVGNLQIAGISVTPGYLNNPEANRESFTPDGWFVTGDLGIIRDGELTIVGRAKDVIIINGANFYCHEIEAIAEDVEGVDVSFTAACGVMRPGDDSERLCIFFSPTAAAADRMPELMRTLRSTVAQRAGIAPDFLIPLARQDVPKTAIGKVQRSLLKERFERGEFASTPAPSPDDTDPMPLLQRVWRPSELPAGELPAGSTVLVFADAAGLGDRLADRLRASGHAHLTVRIADTFADGGDTIALDPSQADSYDRLFAALDARGFIPSHVIHAWSYAPAPDPDMAAAAQPTASIDLLRLLRAWATPRLDGRTTRLIVVSSFLQADHAPVAFGRAALLGIVHTIPHEYDWLDCVSVDFDSITPARDADAILAEAAEAGARAEVAIRDGIRHIAVLTPLPDNPAQASFVEGGFYVIGGARGGIGRTIAKHLRDHHAARLLLLGRSAVDPVVRDDHVIQWAGDIADPAAIQEAVAQAATRFGRAPDGFLHLAGIYHETPLAEETDDAFLATVRAKLTGAWALHQVARAYPGCLFVNFSSLLSYFGALGTSAYAAANASLDAFARQQRGDGVRALAIRWSLWTGTGMGRTVNRDALRLRGYLDRSPEENIALLERAIRSDGVDALVGLDVRNRSIQSHLDPSVAAAFAAGTSNDYVAPRTDTERALATLWQDLLGVERVGVEDNFFDLGGRSLLAARMFAWIGKEMGQTLPLATLYQAPTIASLAALLTTPETTTPSRPRAITRALAMQPNGSRPPIFCIPGVGSDVIVFQDLCRHLGPDQPFYGLQARGLDGTPHEGDGDHLSIEALAAEFVHEIRDIQPRGPYHLAGHCFGGLIMWEIARQLHGAGHPINMLALFDPVATNVFPDEIIQQDRLRHSLRKFLRMPMIERVRFAWMKLTSIRDKIIIRQRLGRSIARARLMHEQYRIERYPGPVMIFMAEDSHFNMAGVDDPRLYHEKFADGGATYRPVPGDRDSMLHGDGAAVLARHLRAAIHDA